MLKVKRIVNPSADQFEIVIHGMRNAFESWNKGDSEVYVDVDSHKYGPYFSLGENDKKLLMSLTKFGTSDRKVLRQLPIIMDITAPEYWWRQFDTYKIGTVANSTSQMHTLLKDGFTKDQFSIENNLKGTALSQDRIEKIINDLNDLRDIYFLTEDKEKKEWYWFKILELIPQSFNYTRTVSLNYEVALTIIQQRRNHKLKEWHKLIDYLLEEVPYLKELDEARNSIES